MVAVVLSGVIGRYIYIQIPRTIEGREMSLNEVRQMKTNLGSVISTNYKVNEGSMAMILASVSGESQAEKSGLLSGIIQKFFEDKKTIRTVRRELRQNNLVRSDIRKVTRIIKNELSLNNRIERLQVMQKLFKYWHVAHLPFAIIMLVIVVVHVAVTLALGYKWIF
jgi:hypothetical protein